MEIAPTSIATLTRLRDGRNLVIDDDVHGIARQIREIDPSLSLRFSYATERFLVVQTLEDGEEHPVTHAPELDHRLLERVRKVTRPDYDFAGELEQIEAEARREQEHAEAERLGDAHERLAHAIRADLRAARPGNVYVPSDISIPRRRR